MPIPPPTSPNLKSDDIKKHATKPNVFVRTTVFEAEMTKEQVQQFINNLRTRAAQIDPDALKTQYAAEKKRLTELADKVAKLIA